MKEVFDFYNSTSIKSYNLDETIRYQLKMLDGLDAFTRRHSENVANITCRLCEKLGLSKGFTIYCTTCAYLHDIGKIFIPPAVLQKPGKLTDEEYEIMKTHTSIGYKICMNDLKLRPYAAGTLYHHEALDILVDHARPTVPKSINDALKRIGLGGVGKIDKKILKALFKVVIDDTEYEIVARTDYLRFLKEEIKRISDAQRYYDKMMAALTKDKKEYYKLEIKCYLKPHEDPEKIPQMLEEFHEAYKVRKAHIAKLYDEVKEIKRISI